MEGVVHVLACLDDGSEQTLSGAERPAAADTPDVAGIVPQTHRPRARLAPWQVRLACEMMDSNRPERVMLTEIADRLDMSVNHFIRGFREAEGISPYQWYMQRRIARATKLLHDDTVPLSKVATACGFADQSHFTKAFTRVLGISPGRWRRNLKKNASLAP